MKRLRGRVRRFDEKKGWGFIKPENDQLQEIFVHRTDVNTIGPGKATLHIGQLVSYITGIDPQERLKAEEVIALEGSTTAPVDNVEAEEGCTGEITTFNAPKGFGFIKRHDGRNDVFFHMSNFSDKRKPNKNDVLGMEVSFDVVPAEKGPKAVNILPVENPSWQEEPGDTNGGSNR